MSSHVLSGINELELKTCEQDIYTLMPTGVLRILINLINMYCLKVPETRHVGHNLWPVWGGGVQDITEHQGSMASWDNPFLSTVSNGQKTMTSQLSSKGPIQLVKCIHQLRCIPLDFQLQLRRAWVSPKSCSISVKPLSSLSYPEASQTAVDNYA